MNKFKYNLILFIEVQEIFTINVICSDETFYWDMVVGLTSSMYLMQEDGPGGRLLPGQIIRYPKVQKRSSNIVNSKLIIINFCIECWLQ